MAILDRLTLWPRGSLRRRVPVATSKNSKTTETADSRNEADVSLGARLTVTATEAKNRFGPLLEKAIQGTSVVITKHDRPKAVLLSVAEFETLVSRREPTLRSLTKEFDRLLVRMQSTASRRGLAAAFDASPEELGSLALAHAKRRS